ncbi:hypothetical protein HGM15179_001716 [Zosterops borbonicus]|nr:hypothetical protein HGM15179_001716 [Zosterops borbonicus]
MTEATDKALNHVEAANHRMAETHGLMDRLEKAVTRLESLFSDSHRSGGMECDGINGVNGSIAPYVEAFDRLLNGSVAEFLRYSKILEGDVKTHAEMVRAAFQAQRSFLVLASQCQEPQENEVAMLLKPISEKIQEIQNFRERNRGSKMFNHLSAVSESIPALGWIAVSPKPGPYVKEMNDAATFYTNRVLKDYKNSDTRHVDWVKSYLNIWSELQAYIKEHHTTGLTWSKTGPVASPMSMRSVLTSGSCLSPPPPPPPLPGPPPILDTETAKDEGTASRSALFAQLNQGEAITKGLRHVSDDQKTHKNPSLRAQGPPVRSPTKSHTPSPTSPKNSPQQSHAPVLELEGKKWRVEYQEDKNDLVINNTELKQVAYIFKCNKSTLQIKGKINSITIDNCKKFGLVFDNVVGILEVINSRDIQIQVMGKVPTISINKTEGCHIYLSEESLDCEIVSAKSSEMNILIPHDGREFLIPSLAHRFIAEMVDFFILFFIKATIILSIMHLSGIKDISKFAMHYIIEEIDEDTSMEDLQKMMIVALIYRLLVCFYEIICIWGAGGATPGKFLLGLRVVTCETSVLIAPSRVLVIPSSNVSMTTSTVRALIKNFSIASFFPAFITLLFFQHNRTAYDIVAGTIVVRRNGVR